MQIANVKQRQILPRVGKIWGEYTAKPRQRRRVSESYRVHIFFGFTIRNFSCN